jgi:geranylgeranyl pyrophosphate synthase
VAPQVVSVAPEQQSALESTTAGIIAELGFEDDIERLRAVLNEWMTRANFEMQAMLGWQFGDRAKYFRPLTIFGCHRAVYGGDVPDRVVRAAAVLEMMHNVSLIIDDIVDLSDERRGKATLHQRFGLLPALMASGYIAADGFAMSAADPRHVGLFAELLKRLGVAECRQWRLRRQPLGFEDWLEIAGEDTGSMFEICAKLAIEDERLAKFGRKLGILYHGCDDVGDVKGLESLGGGGEEDLRDGILTLPASLAIRDPRIAALFCKETPSARDLAQISKAMTAALPEAEGRLDEIAMEAKWEATLHAEDPSGLIALVDHTRQLSRR